MLFSKWKAFRLIGCLRDALASLTREQSILTSRLGYKLLGIVAGVVILGTAFSSILTLSLQRQQLIEGAQTAASHVSDAILASLEHAMLNKEPGALQGVIAAAPGEIGVERVRMLDASGVVRLSSDVSEVGSQILMTDPLCSGCHRATTAALPMSAMTADMLLNVNVIPNQPACQRCHGSQSPVLGLLLVETPLAGLNAQLRASFWRIVLAGLTSFVLLVGLMMPALNLMVIRPVRELARGAAEIGAGNLDYRAGVRSDDELGDLAGAFEAMRAQIKATRSVMEQRNRELATLNDIAGVTSQLLDPQQILNLTIDVTVNSLCVAAGSISLLNVESGRFTLHACQGMAECTRATCRMRAVRYALVGRPGEETGLVYVPDMASEERCYGLWNDPQGRAYVGIPLRADGVTIGAMALITHPDQRLTDEGARTLAKIGEAVGRALGHALRYHNVRYFAAVEERGRLAREMHDSLAQALAYLKMKASITDELLSGGQIDMARQSLVEVKAIVGETYSDVRETIFSLRESAMPGLEFVPALEHYLSEYRLHYGLPVTLDVSRNGTPPTFPAATGIQLYRIVQEALTNVRTHAGASQAWVRLAHTDEEWQITVEDNGRGFDPTRIESNGRQHFGVQIMRERAESVGARLELDSQPGRGTQVVVTVPMAPGDHAK